MHKELANAIRFLSIDAVEAAKSGHPGMPMGMAEIAVALWKYNLKHNPRNPTWFNRDRFVLSNGHGSMLLYSLLHLTGYDLSIEELKNFRQLGSKTPGHPELDIDTGIETTTGPLGQGLGNAVGMALAEKMLASRFNKDDWMPINHYTYAFLGDGCLMEGISHEVCSFAGTHGLGKLICFYDQNGISIDGEISNWFTDNTVERFKSYGWQVLEVDGHDIEKINLLILSAKAELTKPTLICCKTIIGFGSPNKAGTSGVHGSPLGEDEIELTRKELGWDYKPFEIPKKIRDEWNHCEAGDASNAQWNAHMSLYSEDYPTEHAMLQRLIANELPEDFAESFEGFLEGLQIGENKDLATRKASEVCLNFFCEQLPELVGGSADLTGSNNTYSSVSTEMLPENPQGNHIFYGVREFGMTAMMNGMLLHGGIKPYGGTFLVFMDYARNAVRLAALMKIPNIFVYTHDSIGLGEDGPTHQPIEHLVTLRATPNLNNWRPADIIETAVSWKEAIASQSTPHSLILSRQNLPFIERSKEQIDMIEKGGYLLSFDDKADITLISSGSEVKLIIEAAKKIAKEGLKANVVSMPCLDKFLSQDQTFRDSIIDPKLPKLVVEALHPNSWHCLVNLNDVVIGMETFGESAPGKELMDEFGFTVKNIVIHVKKLTSK
ncbi:MAG: transketolase [Gammaproteobacteria bacterium]|nr:transketolase [Gammaproteobacteria bacterium]